MLIDIVDVNKYSWWYMMDGNEYGGWYIVDSNECSGWYMVIIISIVDVSTYGEWYMVDSNKYGGCGVGIPFGLLKTSDGSIKFISRIKRKENDKKAENNKLKIERLK